MSGDMFFRILIGAGLLGLSGYALKKSDESPVRKNPANPSLTPDEVIESLPSVIEAMKNPAKTVVEIDEDSKTPELEEYCYGLATFLFQKWLTKNKKGKVSISARQEYINHMISEVLFPMDKEELTKYLKAIRLTYFKPGSPSFSILGVTYLNEDLDIVKRYNTLRDVFFVMMARFLDRQSFLASIGNNTLLCLPFASSATQLKDVKANKLMMGTWEEAAGFYLKERGRTTVADYQKFLKDLEDYAQEQKKLRAKATADYKKQQQLKKQAEAYYKMIEEEEREDEDNEPLSTYSPDAQKKPRISSTSKITEHDRLRHQRVMMALERHTYKK